jgi:hypothetical protein
MRYHCVRIGVLGSFLCVATISLRFLVGLFVTILVITLVAGTPIIEQFITHWRLRRNDDVPWPYRPFLDYMVQCLILQSVGTEYIFVHKELLEFMAKWRDL